MSGDTPNSDKRKTFIRRLCPELSDDEVAEAEELIARYLLIAFNIYLRKQKEDAALSTVDNSDP